MYAVWGPRRVEEFRDQVGEFSIVKYIWYWRNLLLFVSLLRRLVSLGRQVIQVLEMEFYKRLSTYVTSKVKGSRCTISGHRTSPAIF